ncbi:MAG: enoyl-CoA hydratase/isomerase family protein [Syntrophaceae bacterium]|nr:enoyl-CoA hydratase/isomerase family protein [Syntrophaceae bacterium]
MPCATKSEIVELEPCGNLAVVRLNNGVINSISLDLVKSFAATIAKVKSQFQGIVLAGGDKFFSIGFDISELLAMNPHEMRDFFFKFNDAVLELYSAPIPTACAMKCHAIAGGAILSLACDYRLAASEKTLIGLNEIKLGLPAPYLVDMIVRQVTDDATASSILYFGEFLNADAAKSKGILTEVVPKEDVESRALEIISKIARFNPRAFAETKSNRVETIKYRYQKNHEIKNDAFLSCWFEAKTQELLRDAAEKSFARKPSSEKNT